MALISSNQEQNIAINYNNSIAREIFELSEMYQENIDSYGITAYKDFAEYVGAQRGVEDADEEYEELFSEAVDVWNAYITESAEEYFQELISEELDNLGIRDYDTYVDVSEYYNEKTQNLHYEHTYKWGDGVQVLDMSGEIGRKSPWCIAHDTIFDDRNATAFIYIDPNLSNDELQELAENEKLPKKLRSLFLNRIK